MVRHACQPDILDPDDIERGLAPQESTENPPVEVLVDEKAQLERGVEVVARVELLDRDRVSNV